MSFNFLYSSFIQTLTNLDLERNEITHEGANYLNDALKHNKAGIYFVVDISELYILSYSDTHYVGSSGKCDSSSGCTVSQ